MPVTTRRHSKAHDKYKNPHFHIIERDTNKIKGHSKTLKDAKASARVRNAVTEGGFKPTRGKKKGK